MREKTELKEDGDSLMKGGCSLASLAALVVEERKEDALLPSLSALPLKCALPCMRLGFACLDVVK